MSYFFFFLYPEAQKLPYYASYGPTRLAIHALCTSHYLDLVITFIICINVITMSLEHYDQPQVTALLEEDRAMLRTNLLFLSQSHQKLLSRC